MPNDIKIGIIGGSGMEDPDLLSNSSSTSIKTPYGTPSSDLISGNIDGIEVSLLSRHGKNHSINPSNVNYRANIWSLKESGCTHILAITACGSLREKIAPGHFVFPDQFIDRTTRRINTFYDKDEVKHTPMGYPFDEKMRNCLIESASDLGFKFHKNGTVVTIEGPRFSTKAESMLFRSWNCDIINMSTVPEIILANELGLKYQSIAMSTDYDCWHDSEDDVTMEMIYIVMKKNVKNVKTLIGYFVKRFKELSINKN